MSPVTRQKGIWCLKTNPLKTCSKDAQAHPRLAASQPTHSACIPIRTVSPFVSRTHGLWIRPQREGQSDEEKSWLLSSPQEKEWHWQLGVQHILVEIMKSSVINLDVHDAGILPGAPALYVASPWI